MEHVNLSVDFLLIGRVNLNPSPPETDESTPESPTLALTQMKEIEVKLAFVPEVDVQILAKLDHRTLYNLCLISKYTSELCRNNSFWKEMTKQRFPDYAHGKRENETWLEYYRLLFSLFDKRGELDLEEAIKLGRIEILKEYPLSKIDMAWLRVNAANLAAKHGQADVAMWLRQEFDLKPSQDAINSAAENGHKEILELMEKDILPNYTGALCAGEKGRKDIVEWLRTRIPQSDYILAADGAMMGGHTEILDLLADEIEEITEEVIDEIFMNGRLNTIIWLEEHRLIGPGTPFPLDSSEADLAASGGWPEILDWLASKSPSILPTARGANGAAAEGHTSVLDWMEQRGLPYPGQDGANDAASNGKINTLEWMEKRNLARPNELGVRMAVRYGHTPVIAWMEKRNLPLPPKDSANVAAGIGCEDLLDWLEQHNYPYPDKEGANAAAENGHEHILNWMEKRNLPYPDKEGANKAIANSHVHILEWMKVRKLPRPSFLFSSMFTRLDFVRWSAREWNIEFTNS